MKRSVLALISVSLLLACANEKGIDPGTEREPGTIILISIDTLRSDHLPAYGYQGVSTPALDRLAERSIVFENVWSNVPLTLPSHLSMFTGVVPSEHGVRNNIGYGLGDGVSTIAELLEGCGYETAAFVSSWVLRSGSGIEKGFGTFDDDLPRVSGVSAGELQRPGTETVARATRWLEQTASSDKRFLFLHLYEPHTPWEAPEPYRSRYETPYDAEIAYADSLVGIFVESLQEMDLLDDALVIVTSDHGEGLGDHGELEHGVFLYRESLQVPLLIKLPEGVSAGTRDSRLASLTDIAATISDLADIRSTGSGRSLVGEPSVSRIVTAETLYPRLHLGWSELYAAIDGDAHLIQGPSFELYDYKSDPSERINVAMERRRKLATLRESIEKLEREITLPSAITAEDAERLASLGYVGGVRTESKNLADPRERIGDLELLREASSLTAAGRSEQGIDVLTALLDDSPSFTEAWMLKATLEEKNGNFDSALSSWRQALSVAPELSEELGLSIAAALLRVGRLEEAAEHAKLARSRNPDDAALMIGRIRLRQGRPEDARQESRLLSAERIADAVVLRAESYLAENRLDLAEQEIGRLSTGVRKDEIPVLNQYAVAGDVLAGRGRWNDAIEQLETEVRFHPENLRAWTSLAVANAFAGQEDEVEAVLERMIDENPGRVAVDAAALTLETLGDPTGATAFRRRHP